MPLAVTRTPLVGSPVEYNSDDTDAARGVALLEAFDDAGAGDVITLHDDAEVDAVIAKDGVTLATNATVTNTTTRMFYDNATEMEFTLTGTGTFITLAAPVVGMEHVDSVFTLNGRQFTADASNSSATVTVSFGTLNITATEDLTSTDYDCLVAGAGDPLAVINCDCRNLEAGDNCIESSAEGTINAIVRGTLTAGGTKVRAVAGVINLTTDFELDPEDTDDIEEFDGVVNLFPLTPTIPVNTVAPSISEPLLVGRQTSVDVGTWTPAPVDYLRQWYRANDGAGTGAAAISGETGVFYTITAADSNKYLSCRVIAINEEEDQSDPEFADYVHVYERVALPTPTLVERNLTDLAAFDGKFLFTEATSDADPAQACPNPVTWKNEAPQNTVDWSSVAIAVNTPSLARSLGSGCVKISPNWGIVAAHAPGEIGGGSGYTFMKANGTEVTETRTDGIINIVNDFALILFDDPIADVDIPPIAIFTETAFRSAMPVGSQFLGIETDRHLNVLETTNTPSFADPDLEYAATTADVIEAPDSGKPGIILNGTTPILVLSAFHTDEAGPCPSFLLNDIADIIATTGDVLTLYAFASTDTLGPVASPVSSSTFSPVHSPLAHGH